MKLKEAASIVRSKNAGPYRITFDIFFPDRHIYERVHGAGHLTRSAVAKVYGISPNEVIGFAYFPFTNAVKFSLQRPIPSGGAGDSDVYGAQQHAPLLDLDVL